MKTKVIISAIVIISIVVASVKFLNVREILHIIRGLSWISLAIISLITFLILLLKTWRYRLLNDFRGIKLSYWQTLKVFTAGQTTSVLPAGETLRAYLVEDETNTSFLVALGPVFVLAVFDVVTTTFLFLIGSFMFTQFIIPAFVLAFGLGLFLFILIDKSVLKKILSVLRPFKNGRKVESKAVKIRAAIDIKRYFKTNKKSLKLITWQLSLAILTNLMGGLLFFVIAGALSVQLNYLVCIFIYTASVILQVIGIVPAGLGIMDGGVTGMLVIFGVPFSTSAAIVIIYRLVTFTFGIILGGVSLLGFYPKVILGKGKKK